MVCATHRAVNASSGHSTEFGLLKRPNGAIEAAQNFSGAFPACLGIQHFEVATCCQATSLLFAKTILGERCSPTGRWLQSYRNGSVKSPFPVAAPIDGTLWGPQYRIRFSNLPIKCAPCGLSADPRVGAVWRFIRRH